MTGKRIVQTLSHNKFINEAFDSNERNARGKKSSSMKADLKKSNRKIRRDKNYKNEL